MELDTHAILQAHYPHLAQIADELETLLATIHTVNAGYGNVEFKSDGLDKNGQLSIKYFDYHLRTFRKRKAS